MANLNETKTICECQHIVALSNDEVRKTRDNFNNVPNIHEIDEEESESEETTTLEQLNSASHQEDNKVALKSKDDDEFAYIGESFCSDESCESEVTSVTLGSLKSLSLLDIADLQHSPKKQDTGINEWKDDFQNESYSLNDRPSRAATASGFAKSRRCKRWNMSFTDEEMRKIGRENELLLRKIMAQQRARHKIINECPAQSRLSSSAINRKKLQKKIEDDNMMLLRRIQQAKSRVFTNSSKIGCRLTFL